MKTLSLGIFPSLFLTLACRGVPGFKKKKTTKLAHLVNRDMIPFNFTCEGESPIVRTHILIHVFHGAKAFQKKGVKTT